MSSWVGLPTFAESASPPIVHSPPINPSTSAPDFKRSASDQDEEHGKKNGKGKRRKVNHACLYCRRSHMTCDEGRPCQRCIKRDIGHLCHDEPRQNSTSSSTARAPDTPQAMPPTAMLPDLSPSLASSSASMSPTVSRTMSGTTMFTTSPALATTGASAWVPPTSAFLSQPDPLGGNEFSVLSDFLETLDERSFFNSVPDSQVATVAPQLVATPFGPSRTISPPPSTNADTSMDTSLASTNGGALPSTALLPAATKAEKFLLTAADQADGSRDERLSSVIRSKYEAGLLKPYNYVKGYARLSRWMDRNVSQDSKQQIVQQLSVVRPKFRSIAQSLTDIDLVFIEEAFERLLLDYDRVFSAMGVPACLWRRTGEIYKGNREFAELVGVDGYMLRDGRLCIYELMAEDSAVNYWEKYGHVAFDPKQKAVLTSCVLRYKPVVGPIAATAPSKSILPASKKSEHDGSGSIPHEEGFVNCCFSFTIRRDTWGIPSMIVGNFIRC